MPVEPVSCTSCSRKFSPKFARCPFCNAARASAAPPERCAECGRERSAGLTACPYCHPELVAIAPPPAPEAARPLSPAAADAVRRALDTVAQAPPEPSIPRWFLLASAVATSVGLLGTLACVYFYDPIGVDLIGKGARGLGLLAVLVVGAWMRSSLRKSSVSFERLRSFLVVYVLAALPATLLLYTFGNVFNRLGAEEPVEVVCQLGRAQGSDVAVDCHLPPSGRAMSGKIRASRLRDRGIVSQAFVAPARDGALGTWLLDVSGAREYSPRDRGPRLPGREPPLLGPNGAGRIVNDEDGDPRFIPWGAPSRDP